MYHYTYRITNKVEPKHYYGARTFIIHPSQDLGIKYFSSSTDKEFITDQISNPENFKYKIIKIFETREEALALEIKFHTKFNVGMNESFYNKAKQTSTRFDTSGTVGYKFNKDIIEKRIEKYKETVNSTEWKESKGKIKSINIQKNILPENRKLGSEKRLQKLNQENDGATGFEKMGLKISKTLLSITDNGTTLAYEISKKGTSTKLNTVHENGLNTCQNATKIRIENMKNDIIGGKNGIIRSTEKMVLTRSTIDENNLSSFQKGARKGVETCKNTILKNGLSLKESQIIKAKETRKNKTYDGKSYKEFCSERFTGSKNPVALHIFLHNDKDEIIAECNGSFLKYCTENKLPYNTLRNSSKDLPAYCREKCKSEHSYKVIISTITKNGNIKYKGWYIKIIEK